MKISIKELKQLIKEEVSRKLTTVQLKEAISLIVENEMDEGIFATAADKLKGAFGKTPKALPEPCNGSRRFE